MRLIFGMKLRHGACFKRATDCVAVLTHIFCHEVVSAHSFMFFQVRYCRGAKSIKLCLGKLRVKGTERLRFYLADAFARDIIPLSDGG